MYALTKSMTRLATTTIKREDDDQALDRRVVTVLEVHHERMPEAGPVERRLGEHGAGQEERHGETDDGDHRNECVPERVVVDDRVLVDPSRSRSLDVVVLHRADHVDADQPDEDPGRDEAERHRGQDEVLDRRPRARSSCGR